MILINRYLCQRIVQILACNITGDVLLLDKSEEETETIVKRLHPLYCKNTEGYVEEVMDGAGIIACTAMNVWFTRDVLDGGYQPIVGDRVTFRAIKSSKSGMRCADELKLVIHYL